MAINERVITGTTAAAADGGAASAEENLILHLDANDVDSYDGDGTVWYDISEHDVTIPLSSDDSDNLKIHYNPSDTNSYSGTGATMSNLAGSSLDATVVASRFDIDNGGFFDVSTDGEATIGVPTGHPLNGTNFTLEFWFNWTSTPSAGNRFIYIANTGWNFFYYAPYGWRINNADVATGYFSNGQYITVGKWHHCVIAQDSSNCKIYFDGELVKTQSVTSGTRSLGAFNFGSTEITADKPKCKIGSIRMYNSTLSASEVGQNYRHGRDYIYTDLAGIPFLHYNPADTNSYGGTGTTLTDLAGNNDADLLNNVQNNYDEELGNSFDFTSTNQAIKTNGNVSINPASGMTVEMWFKIDSDTQNYLFSFNGTGATGYGLSYRSNTDKVTFFYRTGASTNSNISSPTVTVNKWHHLVATTDGSGAQIYLDGEVGDTTTSNAYSITYNEPLHFGNFYGLSQAGYHQVGQIRFYKGHLTADEVMQNYLFTKNDYPNGYNGTITNAGWNSSGYFNFDGDNDIVTISGFYGSVNQSWVFWINPDTIERHFLASTYGSGIIPQGAMYVEMTSSGTIEAGVRNSSSTTSSVTTSTALTASNWHHIAVTSDGSDLKVYVNNGTPVSTTATVTSLASNSQSLVLCYDPRNIRLWFNGQISDFKAFDKALTSAEVTAEYNKGQFGEN